MSDDNMTTPNEEGMMTPEMPAAEGDAMPVEGEAMPADAAPEEGEAAA